jgi:hypothetical protein
MEEEYDYESLGQSSTMAQNATAGALAGIAEHCLMYPVDSIKVKIKRPEPPVRLTAYKGSDIGTDTGFYRRESKFCDRW